MPVLIHDRSGDQITKGLALMDKLLAKDVSKGKIQAIDAKEARERVKVVPPEVGLKGLRDVDMVVEVCLLHTTHLSSSNIATPVPFLSHRQYQSPCLSNNLSSPLSQPNSVLAPFLQRIHHQSASQKLPPPPFHREKLRPVRKERIVPAE